MTRSDGLVEFSGPPPAAHTTNTRHARIVAQLVNNPGKWAVIGRYGSAASARSTALNIRTGKLAAYTPAGAFDAVARTVHSGDESEFRVYARFIGAGGGAEAA
ncbi:MULTISPECIES: hypothetical protein [unclassified Streptomyces]|uniref:hypothetical protein n=1 Tax=unclassified Streptomyces TaxID=2593676 RepID=UPI000370DB6E|nr:MULTISPECIES: hypothetical protein [unclassified Streptomyces]MYT30490.1 hypothetical protein [Streptomyces sp. SID8354]